jgi:ABC-2 type transport system permease protein
MLLSKRGALIKNERLKMYKKPSTWILMGVIVLVTLLNLLFSRLMISSYDSYQASWQEEYGYRLESYQMQLKENPDDFNAQQSIESIKYLLDNDIPPQDWRTDVVIEYYNLKTQQLALVSEPKIEDDIPTKGDFDFQFPGGKFPGNNQSEISEEQLIARMDKLQKILKENDWKVFVNLKIDDLKSGYSTVNNEQEKQVNIEIYEIYLEQNIVPSAENMFYYYYGGRPSSSVTWKSQQVESIRKNKLNLLRGETEYGEMLTKSMRKSIQRDIDISLKRLGTDTPPIESNSFLGLLENASSSIGMLSILMIVYAGGIFASEYSSGTIKLLLITPHKRRKVFWAKAALLLELTAIALAANFILAFLISGFFTAFKEIGAMQIFSLFGNIVRIPYILYIVIRYLLLTLPVLVYGSLAMMLSLVTRRSSISTAVTLLLVFGSEIIMSIIAMLRQKMIIPGIKFLLFANTSLENYLPSAQSMFTGLVHNMVDATMTLGFSIAVLLVYMVCFLWIAHDSFCRRDVK